MELYAGARSPRLRARCRLQGRDDPGLRGDATAVVARRRRRHRRGDQHRRTHPPGARTCSAIPSSPPTATASPTSTSALVGFHEAHDGSATVTTVPLHSQYGTLELGAGARVERFTEKPILDDHWINGGFFVFDQRAFEHWKGDDLEREVLPGLAALGQLYAYRHRGFWKSMDTYKDALELTALCGEAPGGVEASRRGRDRNQARPDHRSLRVHRLAPRGASSRPVTTSTRSRAPCHRCTPSRLVSFESRSRSTRAT